MKAEFLPCGDTALTVEFGKHIDRKLSGRILQLCRLIEAASLPGLVETVPTYRSLLIHYDPAETCQREIIEGLEPLLHGECQAGANPERHWNVPVCFEDGFSPDMAQVAAATGLAESEIVTHLTGTEHHVYMLGFAPGQPYMGDLPAVMKLPRRKRPVPRIERGSVATATGLTIIYSLDNPTGWHVVGRTPVRLFDLRRDVPILLRPGDKVNLQPIGGMEFGELETAIEEGQFDHAGLMRS